MTPRTNLYSCKVKHLRAATKPETYLQMGGKKRPLKIDLHVSCDHSTSPTTDSICRYYPQTKWIHIKGSIITLSTGLRILGRQCLSVYKLSVYSFSSVAPTVRCLWKCYFLLLFLSHWLCNTIPIRLIIKPLDPVHTCPLTCVLHSDLVPIMSWSCPFLHQNQFTVCLSQVSTPV